MDSWDSIFAPAAAPVAQPTAAPQDEDPWAAIFASTAAPATEEMPAKQAAPVTKSPPREKAESIRDFAGKQDLTVEDALEGGYAKGFLAHLRERADKLPVGSKERDEISGRIAGLQVDLGEYDRQTRESKKLGVSRDTLVRGESAVGAAEGSLGKQIVGQTALRAEQAASGIAETVLSLGDRAIGSGKMSAQIHKDKALRDEFLNAVEAGGDVEKYLGKTGSRIYNGAVGSIAKFALVGTVAGPSAVYSMIAGEAYDDGLEEAKKNGMTGVKANAYAGAKATAEAGISAVFGKVLGKYGVKLMETQFSPGMRKVVADTAEKSLKGVRGKLTKELAGVSAETIEELVTDVVSQGIELTAGVSKGYNLGRTLEAAAGGAVGRSATGVAKAYTGAGKDLNDAIKKVHPQMVEESIKGVLAAESIDPVRAQAALDAGNRQEFEAALGIKNTSETYREAFKTAVTANQEAEAEAAATQPEAVAPEAAAPVAPEAPVPPPADPAAPAAPVAGTPPAGGTSTIKAELQQMMKDLGAPTVYSPARQKQLDAMEQAISEGRVEQAMDFSTELMENPRPIDDVERGGLLVAIAQRKKQYRDLARSMSQPGADLPLVSATMNRLRAESEALVAASMTAGTKTAQALAMHKFRIDDDYDIDSALGRARVGKGAPLTEQERDVIAASITAMDDANAATEAANQKIDNDVANQVIQQAAKPANDIDALYKRMNELLGKGCATE